MSQDQRYDDTAAAARRPTTTSSRDDRELIRLASLAASSHNTQPWTFSSGADGITIRADDRRRCAVVDPHDAHLFKSLGCAAENIVQACGAQGLVASVSVDPQHREVVVRLDTAEVPATAPLLPAILTRQCTRSTYDGQPLATDDLRALERAGTIGSARCTCVVDAGHLAAVADLVESGDRVQLSEAEFRKELVSWIRFNPAHALATGDGLAGRATGQPSVPTWFGRSLQRLLIRAGHQAAQDRDALESSAGVAVITTAGDQIRDWVDAGRAVQRLALVAESIGVRTAFVNQPIEVAGLRDELERVLGLDGRRAQLAVRFGRGDKLPYSLRRDLTDIIDGATGDD